MLSFSLLFTPSGVFLDDSFGSGTDLSRHYGSGSKSESYWSGHFGSGSRQVKSFGSGSATQDFMWRKYKKSLVNLFWTEIKIDT